MNPLTLAKEALTAVIAPLVAIVAAMIITSIVIAATGSNPGDFWRVIIDPPPDRIYVNIVNQTSMIYLSGLAAAIGFRMNLFNIGVEGQYQAASFAAAVVVGAALVPGLLNVLLGLIVAIAVGASVAAIAGLLKVLRGVSEVISTIMLNAIVLTMVGYLLNTYGLRLGNSRRTTEIPESSQIGGWAPFLDRDGSIWTLALLAVFAGALFSFVINRTSFGFDLRATGMSETAAVASGVKVNRMIVVSMLMSGGIAGLIWMPAFFGSAHNYGTTFQAGLGFTGIAVALLGRNKPLGILFGALLFAFLNEQSNRLTLETDISANVVQITQGTIVLTVVVAYEVFRRRRAAAEQRAVTTKLELSTQEAAR